MPRTLRSLTAVVTSAVVITGLAACAPGATTSSGDSASATILLGAGFSSLDPALATDSSARTVQSFLYDKLIGQNPETGEAVSNLASSWDISSSAAHFEITEGVTCSDGTPFTAETVVRNLERMKDPATAAPLTGSYLGSYDYTVALGANGTSVDITFPEPLPFPERKLAEGPGMVCDSGLDNPASLEDTSAGTGPYVLTSSTTGDTYSMKVRDDYTWGIDAAAYSTAMPETVTFRFLADPDAMANLVISGDADIAALGGAANTRVKAAGDATTELISNAAYSAFFNHREGFSTADVAVRTALSQAASAEDFTAVASEGTAQPATSLTSPTAECSAAGRLGDVIPVGGADAASATLKDAGWLKNDAGIWEKDGAPLTIRILSLDVDAAGIEYLRSSYAAIGVDAVVDSRSGSEAVTAAFGGTDWEVAVTGYGAATPPLQLLGGGLPPNGSNFAAIDNANFASAVSAARTSGDCADWIAAESALLSSADLQPLMIDPLEYVSLDYDLTMSTFFPVPTSIVRK